MTKWYEHERIKEIDDYANADLTHDEIEEFMHTFTDSYEDWADYVGDWLQDKISVLQTIQELVDDLPDELSVTKEEDKE